MAVTPERTDQICFSPLKFERKRALELIRGEAGRHSLRVESVNERRRRLTIEVQVTVTGASEDILSFCKTTGGTAKHDPRSRVRRWIDAASNVRYDPGGPY
jgi:hypothetical protein